LINLSTRKLLSRSWKRQQKMKATTLLNWLKNRPRYSLAILVAAASSYAIDRWFFSGVIASKWIGLPQYASAMRELQNESRNWGIVALVLEIVALALVLPRWPKKELALPKNFPITLSSERNARTEYLGLGILSAGLCLLGTLGLAILIPLIGNFFWAVIHAK
jgi:hypothetical protein